MSPFVFAGLLASYTALMAAYPVFPPIARQLGLSELQTGFLISLSAAAMAVASPFWGRLSETWGRKRVFVIGLVGAGLAIGLFTLVTHAGLMGLIAGPALFVLLALARMPLGLLVAAAPVAAQAHVADVTDSENRSAGMAMIGAASGLGLIVGPAVAAVLVVFGLLVPFYASAVIVLAAAFMVWLAMPEAATRPPSAGQTPPRLWDRRIWPFLTIGFGSVTMVSLVQVSIGFFLIDRFALSVPQAGQSAAVAFLVVGLVLVATQGVLLPRIKWPPLRMMRLGLPLMAAGFAMLILAPTVWALYLAFAVMGFGAGFTFPGFQAAVTLAVGAEEQGQVAGLTGSANAAGAVIGPLAGTALYHLGPAAPYWAAVLVLAGLTLFVMSIGRSESQAA